MARTSTYLNFPGNTEAAFNFYKSIFGGEFGGTGISRFNSMPPTEGMPALSPGDENLILHIELEILGGHIIMGTDAPESMGFTLHFGNNISLNLEPDSKEETLLLFEGLSAGGKVTTPLQDMFWGAYFGSCIDRFGIQWTFNCQLS
jgi:PhnB protein